MARSILINAMKPIDFASNVINECSKFPEIECTVVNVSSGDGELVYLHSTLQDKIEKVADLKVCTFVNLSPTNSQNATPPLLPFT